jgi:phosphoesterase RecJ-like protein
MTKAMDEKISAEIASHDRFLITSHVRPDADAVGSLLAVGLALEDAGKSVQYILQDEARNFEYMPGWEHIQQAPQGPAEIIIVVDCSDPRRVGNVLDDYGSPDIVVDHHKTNIEFARINLVESSQVATAAILFDHLPQWGLTITPDVAACLLAGIVGDTIGFRTSNVNSEAMRKAAALMDLGADLPSIYRDEVVAKSYTAVRYWGAGLSRLSRDNGLIWTCLTLDDKKEIGYSGTDDADLVNVLSSVSEADIALIFIEQLQNHVKVSWRARPGLDVSGIAFSFGGGGHAAAAGADIEGNLEEVMQRVIDKTRKFLDHKTPIGG